MRYLTVLAILIAGCATPQERAQRLIATHAPFCDALGYQRSSEEWRRCVLARIQQAQGDTANALNLYNSIKPRGCQFVGNQMICD